MKQNTFIITAIAFFTLTLSAEATNLSKNSFFRPIEFIEQGIHFTIFQNGAFDFRFDQNQIYNRNRHSHCNTNRSIVKDYHGKVRRVGTVTIDYDRYGRLTRVGNIDIHFRNRMLTSVGGLYIHYNNFGYMDYSGTVNRIKHHHKKHHYKARPKHHKKNKFKPRSSRRYKKSRRA